MNQISPTSSLHVEVADRQSLLQVDEAALAAAVRVVLGEEGIVHAAISVAVVDDGAIHELNVRFLGHDYPTDVLTFPLERGEDSLEGEIVVSAETAARMAAEIGWPAADELTLYVVHGALHLAGYDDVDDESAAEMRRREGEYLSRLGVVVISQ